MTALPNKHYSGHRKATEIEGDQRTRGKEIWRKNGHSRFQVQLEEDGGSSTRQSWMKTSSPPGTTRLKSSTVSESAVAACV